MTHDDILEERSLFVKRHICKYEASFFKVDPYSCLSMHAWTGNLTAQGQIYPASKVLSYFFSARHGEARETLQNLCIH
jgi:hypothetical protein